MTYTKKILKNNKKELILKIITSLFIQGLLLVIPIFWSKTINNLSEGIYKNTYYLVLITVLLSILYYIWSYINQKTWYRFYNKLYLDYTSLVIKNDKDNLKKSELGEYTNIINSDIDIICTFLGNGITRIIQILEFFVIYLYFFSLNFYIFLVTVIVSIIMMLIFVKYAGKIQEENKNRKENLDKKTSMIHKLYGSSTLKIFAKNQDNLYKSSIEYLKSNAIFNIFTLSIIYIVLAIIELSRYIIVFYSVYLVSIGNMEIGTILLIYTYYSKIVTNFEVLGTISAEYQSFKVSLKRLDKIKVNT